MRTIIFWSLFWGPLVLGNYYVGFREVLEQGCQTRKWGLDSDSMHTSPHSSTALNLQSNLSYSLNSLNGF